MSLLLPILLCAPGEIQTVPSTDFPPALQRRAIVATVRIVNQAKGHLGTGIILKADGPFVYVLTAAHILDKTGKLEISTFNESTYPRTDNVYYTAEVMARLKDQDVALLRLATRDRMPGALRICPPRLIPKEKTFPVLTVGCSSGEAPTCLIDKVIDQKHVRKELTSGVSYVWELSRQHLAGRSGGPLLDRHGYILGVCSGTTDRKGYYCHIDEIHQWLKNNGLQWLYEEEKK